MAETKQFEQLHVGKFPTAIKKKIRDWGAKQTPQLNLSDMTIMVLKKWVDSDFTTPQIGETVAIDEHKEREKQRLLEEYQKKLAEIEQA